MKWLLLIGCGFFLFFNGQALAGSDSIGGLRNVEGSGHITREGRDVIAKNGGHIFAGDILKTGSDGSLGIIFNDNTRISLGPDSAFTVSQYVFEPGNNKFAMLKRKTLAIRIS